MTPKEILITEIDACIEEVNTCTLNIIREVGTTQLGMTPKDVLLLLYNRLMAYGMTGIAEIEQRVKQIEEEIDDV